MYSRLTRAFSSVARMSGQPAGLVGHFDGDHVGDLHHEALLLQELLGLLPVAHDEAQDAELLGVGDGERQDVELGLGEQFDRAG